MTTKDPYQAEFQYPVVERIELNLANYYGRVSIVKTQSPVLKLHYYYMLLDCHSSTNKVRIAGLTYHALKKDTGAHHVGT
jgi:hypothetical protein